MRVQPTINFALYGARLAACISIPLLANRNRMQTGEDGGGGGEEKKETRVVKARRIIAAQQDDFLAGLSGRSNNDREKTTGSLAEAVRGTLCVSLPLSPLPPPPPLLLPVCPCVTFARTRLHYRS